MSQSGQHMQQPNTVSDAHGLAVMLEPLLASVASAPGERGQARGTLGKVEWFKSVWQRGGAATGFAPWTFPNGQTTSVLVKFPIGAIEQRWTCALGDCDHASWNSAHARGFATPRVIASGIELGGYDFAWLITEKLHGKPPSARLTKEDAEQLLRTAAEFQRAAIQQVPDVNGRPKSPDWATAVARSRELCRDGSIPESQRWMDPLKQVQKLIPRLQARWESRKMNAWCHGDVHPGNLLHREPNSDDTPGRPVLIDLALVHPGHWLEDALYLERQYWGHTEYLHGMKPVSELARIRRELGLCANDDYAELANVRRVLMAACAPGLFDREGNLKYLHAALEWIEKLLPQVAKA